MATIEKQQEGIRVLTELYRKQPELAEEGTRQEAMQQFNELSKRLALLKLEKSNLEEEKTAKSSPSISVLWHDNDMPSITKGKKKVKVMYDFEPDNDMASFAMAIRKGEQLTVLESEGDWWRVSNDRNETGHVPHNYISQI